MTISTRVDPDLENLAETSARQVGLKVSDLVRTGLHRVCEEIRLHGSLRVSPTAPARKRKGGKK